MLPENIYKLSEQILIDSIKYPTVLGEAYEDIVKYYAELLSKHGIESSIIRVPDDYLKKTLPPDYHPERPRYILLARIGSGEKILQFNGHYDVVFPGEGWTVTEPFKPVVKDGKIYGRGSTDMKGGIAAFLAAMIYAAEKLEDLGIVVEAAIVPDEEIGGLTGTGYLVKELKSRPTWVVIAEPSGEKVLWHGHKGAVWAEVIVKGKQTHGSVPFLGVNAFEKMVYVAKHLIENYIPSLKKKKSRYNYDIPGGEYPTATLGGKLTSPGSINIVPGRVSFSIDRRLIVEEKASDIMEELRKTVEEASRAAGADTEIRFVQMMDPAFTDPEQEIVEATVKAAKTILGYEPRRSVCIGGLDLRYYTEVGVQGISYGPGDPNVPHKVDEYMPVESLHRFVDIYVELIKILNQEYGSK